MFQDKNKSTMRVGVTMFIMSVGCKALGFIRQMLLANCFGTGDVVDSYVMAQSIPNILFGGILVAFSTAYMPLLSQRYEEKGVEAANRYTSRIIRILFVLSVLATVLGILFSREILMLAASGLNGNAVNLASFYLKFTFGYTFFAATVGILSNYLQYKGIFTSQIIGDYIQNIFFLIFIWSGYIKGSWLLILGPFLGILFRWLYLYVLTRLNGFKLTMESGGTYEVLQEIANYALPVFIGTTAFEINTYVDRYLGARLESGSISALNYAYQLSTVMMELTVTILTTILYPKLVRAATTNDMEQFKKSLYRGLNLCGLISIPLAVGSVIYSNEIVTIIFERGEFVSKSTGMTSRAYLFYSISIFFLAVITLLTKVCYSLGDMKTPVFCAIIGIIVNIAGDFILIKPMAVSGLALATSIANMVNAILLIAYIQRSHNKIDLFSRENILAKIIIATMISIGIGYMLYRAGLAVTHAISNILFIIAVIISVTIYLLILRLFKIEEMNQIWEFILHEKE